MPLVSSIELSRSFCAFPFQTAQRWQNSFESATEIFIFFPNYSPMGFQLNAYEQIVCSPFSLQCCSLHSLLRRRVQGRSSEPDPLAGQRVSGKAQIVDEDPDGPPRTELSHLTQAGGYPVRRSSTVRSPTPLGDCITRMRVASLTKRRRIAANSSGAVSCFRFGWSRPIAISGPAIPAGLLSSAAVR